MPQVVKIKVKKKRNVANNIAILCIVLGLFLLILGYIGDTYDIADYLNNGDYEFREKSSIFYGKDHILGAIAGLSLILIGLLIKYRKKITNVLLFIQKTLVSYLNILCYKEFSLLSI